MRFQAWLLTRMDDGNGILARIEFISRALA